MKPHEKDRNRLRGGSASAVAAVSAHGSQSKGRLLDEAVRSELVVTHNASRRINFVQARRPESSGAALNSLQLVPLNSVPDDKQGAGHKRSRAEEPSDAPAGPATPKFALFDESSLQMAWERPFQMGAGLRNLGNTCFLNATLQCLTYVPPLANYVLSHGHVKFKNTKSGFSALFALGEHIRHALNSPGKQLSPNSLVGNLKRIGRMFRPGRQEDAHEFMRYLVEAMQAACIDGKQLPPGVADTSVVHRLFGGMLRSCLQCSCCAGRPSLTYDPFLDLSLEINRAQSVEQALARFCALETLDGDNKYRCERTNRKVTATKHFTIDRAPNVLTLQLKRFEYGARGGKIDRLVKFSLALDLGPYMSQPSRGDAAYALTGVLVHQGRSTHSGHYYAFVRSPAGGWYRMDDERVHPVSEAMVCSQQAYMLFYTKQIAHAAGGAHSRGAAVPKQVPPLDAGQQQTLRIVVSSKDAPPPKARVTALKNKSAGDAEDARQHAPLTPPSPAKTSAPRRMHRVVDKRTAGKLHLVARKLQKKTSSLQKKKRKQGSVAAEPEAKSHDQPVVMPAKKVKAQPAVAAAAPELREPDAAETAKLRAVLSFPRHYNAYGVDGIPRWSEMENTPAAAAADALVRQQRPAFSSKRRGRDEYEESYDRGKVKRVRMARLDAGGNGEGNPFEAAHAQIASRKGDFRSKPKRGGGSRSGHKR